MEHDLGLGWVVLSRSGIVKINSLQASNRTIVLLVHLELSLVSLLKMENQ
jgi:hypothetical protein